MAHNARSDTFAAGSAEGGPIFLKSVEELKKLPSGDAPGKTVGDVLPAKRTNRGHRMHVLAMKAGAPIKPVTIKNGVFIDGHHRVAAAEDADRLVPTRYAPK